MMMMMMMMMMIMMMMMMIMTIITRHQLSHSSVASSSTGGGAGPSFASVASKVMRRGRSPGSHRVQSGPPWGVTTRTTFDRSSIELFRRRREDIPGSVCSPLNASLFGPRCNSRSRGNGYTVCGMKIRVTWNDRGIDPSWNIVLFIFLYERIE